MAVTVLRPAAEPPRTADNTAGRGRKYAMYDSTCSRDKTDCIGCYLLQSSQADIKPAHPVCHMSDKGG